MPGYLRCQGNVRLLCVAAIVAACQPALHGQGRGIMAFGVAGLVDHRDAEWHAGLSASRWSAPGEIDKPKSEGFVDFFGLIEGSAGPRLSLAPSLIAAVAMRESISRLRVPARMRQHHSIAI
jgi:hypothetical protein